MNDQRWLIWWRISIFISLAMGAIGGVWVSIGGLFDLKKMFRRLRSMDRNVLDDGRVSGELNLADIASESLEDEAKEQLTEADS